MPRRKPNRYLHKAEQQVSIQGTAVAAVVPSSAPVPQSKDVPSWTADGTRYYYDLVHGRGREVVFIQLYDTHTNSYFWPDEAKPGSPPETTLRIWVTNNFAANRIRILYL